MFFFGYLSLSGFINYKFWFYVTLWTLFLSESLKIWECQLYAISRACPRSLWVLVSPMAHAGIEPVKVPISTRAIYTSCFSSLITRAFWPCLALQPVGLAISLALTCPPGLYNCTPWTVQCHSSWSLPIVLELWEATRALIPICTGKGLVQILSRHWKY